MALSKTDRDQLIITINNYLFRIPLTTPEDFKLVTKLLTKLHKMDSNYSLNALAEEPLTKKDKKMYGEASGLDYTQFENILEMLDAPENYVKLADFPEFMSICKDCISAKIKQLESKNEEQQQALIIDQQKERVREQEVREKFGTDSETLQQQLFDKIFSQTERAIQTYLKKNPKRSKIAQVFTSLIGLGGEEGRQRALAYQTTIQNYKATSKTPGEFATKVIQDLQNHAKNSPLGTSKIFREELFDVIRPYINEALLFNNINEWDVNSRATKIAIERRNRENTYLAAGGEPGVNFPEPERDEAIQLTLEDITTASLQLIQEKKSGPRV